MRHYNRRILLILLCACATIAAGQTPPNRSPLPTVVPFEKAAVNRVDPATLPKPFETKSAFRSSKEIAQPADAKLYLPKGFKLNVFAEGNFREPRYQGRLIPMLDGLLPSFPLPNACRVVSAPLTLIRNAVPPKFAPPENVVP